MASTALRFKALADAAGVNYLADSMSACNDTALRAEASNYRRAVTGLDRAAVSLQAALAPAQPWSVSLVAGESREAAKGQSRSVTAPAKGEGQARG